MSFVFVTTAYLLGSLPFGYVFSKISGKNVLEIGWRKTSGSNVFKNVGIWQGVLTGIFDVAKGFLAVWISQYFGLPVFSQVLCGVAAVVGHNWSIFLKFAGGRGVGTFVGAFFALNPQLLGMAIVPFIIMSLIWDAAIGTILFLATILILAEYFNQFETAGLFALLSLAPIFIKRLSPLKELSLEKPEIIRNRLIFDDDVADWDLRIKRILRQLTET